MYRQENRFPSSSYAHPSTHSQHPSLATSSAIFLPSGDASHPSQTPSNNVHHPQVPLHLPPNPILTQMANRGLVAPHLRSSKSYPNFPTNRSIQPFSAGSPSVLDNFQPLPRPEPWTRAPHLENTRRSNLSDTPGGRQGGTLRPSGHPTSSQHWSANFHGSDQDRRCMDLS